jgi:hypothetical protein
MQTEKEIEELYDERITGSRNEFMNDPASVVEAVSEALASDDDLAIGFIHRPELFFLRVVKAARKYLGEVAEMKTQYPTEDDL